MAPGHGRSGCFSAREDRTRSNRIVKENPSSPPSASGMRSRIRQLPVPVAPCCNSTSRPTIITAAKETTNRVRRLYRGICSHVSTKKRLNRTMCGKFLNPSIACAKSTRYLHCTACKANPVRAGIHARLNRTNDTYAQTYRRTASTTRITMTMVAAALIYGFLVVH